jgi:hypothetical protein
MKRKKVFRSRISVLLCGFILATFIIVSIPVFQEKIYPAMYILGGCLLLVILLSAGMRYVISEDKLFLKNFWFIPAGSVDIGKITAVKRSYNPLSSPAGSLKRLHLTFIKGRFWLISPVREQEFIEALKAINPRIDVNVSYKKGAWRILDWDI